jgi:hypothetical protein
MNVFIVEDEVPAQIQLERFLSWLEGRSTNIWSLLTNEITLH